MERISTIAFLAISIFFVAGCQEDDNRVVSEAISPLGHVFTHMPIWEDGVTDVAVAIAWDSDWALDAARNPLVPHVATSVMQNGGTAALRPEEVLELFEGKNSYARLSATADMIFGEAEFPNNHRNKIVPAIADLLQEPTFDGGWIERRKAELIDHHQGIERNLWLRMWDVGRFAILSEGPQTDFTNGFDTALINEVTRADLLEWHQKSFSASPRAIVVTGAMDASDAGQVVDEILGAPKPAFTADAIIQTADFDFRPIFLHVPDAQKSTIGFVGEMPDTTDGDDVIDLIAAHLFAGGPGSPLFEEIRTELGSTYGLGMGFESFSRGQRIVFIGGEIESEKMADAREAVLQTYESFLETPDMNALAGINSRISEAIRENNGYVNTSARTLRELRIDGLDNGIYATLADRAASMSETEIRMRLKQAFPRAEKLMIVAAGPYPDAFPDACVITDLVEVSECVNAGR